MRNCWPFATTTLIESVASMAPQPTRRSSRNPCYDVKVLDRLVTRVAREIRSLEQALKATNARTTVDAYDQDDAVLGELT